MVANQAYAGLKAPVEETSPSQFVPDFRARYLVKGVPFGLAASRAIAELAGVDRRATGPDRLATCARVAQIMKGSLCN
jgi:hypothetical protein